MDSEGSMGSRATQTWLQPILSAYGCRAALGLPFPSAGVREWQGAGVFQEPAGSEWGGEPAAEGGKHPGSLTENVCAACYFYFALPPRAGAPWCKRSHRTPPGTVAAPFGVARSELTMEKTTPSLPAMCSCSQNYFYSNIHLFTTWDLRGFCFLFGAFYPLPEDAF